MHCMRKQSNAKQSKQAKQSKAKQSKAKQSMTIPGLPSLLHCQPTLRAPPSTHVIQCYNQQLSIPSSSKRNILVHRPGKKVTQFQPVLKSHIRFDFTSSFSVNRYTQKTRVAANRQLFTSTKHSVV